MNSQNLLWPPLLVLLTACLSDNPPPKPLPTLPPSFQLALILTNSSLTLNQGGKNTLQVTITPENSFSGTVSLSLEKQDGAAAPPRFTLSPNALTVADSTNPSNHTVALEIAPDTPTGSYPLRLKAVAGDLSQTADFTLEVIPPGLQLALAQETVGLTRGATASFTLNLVPQGNPNSTISLVLERRDGSPAPANLSLSPGTATVSSNTPVPLTLNLTSSPSTPTGPMALRIRAEGGGLGPGCGGLCADLELFVGARGEPDPTFGNNGEAPLESGACSWTELAVQPDGKLVVTSSCYESVDKYFNLFVNRYNPNGSPDTSFGTAGRVLLPRKLRYASPLAVQPDGKIVVGLSTVNYPPKDSFPVVRYNPDGSLDTTFGRDGEAVADDLGRAWLGMPTTALAIQPDGKIVAVGLGSSSSNYNGGVVRYNPDGSVDASFGTGGAVLSLGVEFSDLALRPDGKIVLAGRTNSSGAVFGYNPDGSPDLTFGTKGMSFGGRMGYGGLYPTNTYYSALALRPDGGIVTAGGYTQSQAADRTYVSAFSRSGNHGWSVERFFGGHSDVIVQPDGRHVVSGSMNAEARASNNFITLARFYGLNLDTTFGTDGLVVANNEQNLESLSIRAMALQPDGKIVGILQRNYRFPNNSYRSEYSLVRYH